MNEIRYVTDSRGIVAFDEPGLMGRKVFFAVKSHGYEYPGDGFGFRGKALDVVSGGRGRVEIKRVNIAERLYRMTGAGIYRDSVLVGDKVPIAEPVLNAQVFGSDSVLNAPCSEARSTGSGATPTALATRSTASTRRQRRNSRTTLRSAGWKVRAETSQGGQCLRPMDRPQDTAWASTCVQDRSLSPFVTR